MTRLRLFGIFGLISLAIATFTLSVLIASPSDAAGANYKRLIALGVIDKVVTAEEIGLSHLSRETFQLSANQELLNAIYEAEQATSRMPEDIALEFPGGTNSPIRIGQISDDTGTPSQATNVSYTSFMRDGRPQNFTPGALSSMFNVEGNNQGNLPRTANAYNMLFADASGRFLQAKRIPVIDLIVRNRKGKKILVRRVNANAVCRDALNAYFERQLSRKVS